MIYDTHAHTRYSVDSSMEPGAAVAAAQKLGLGLCLTEHVDYECDYDDVCVADAGGYFQEYETFRAGGLLLGLEIGLTKNTRAIARQAASDPRLDYVVGSVHVSNGYDIGSPLFWQREMPLKEIMAEYLRYHLLVIEKCGFFDSLGHIDYLSRYCPFPGGDIKYKEFGALYDEIFTALLDCRKVIEINTRRLNEPGAAKNLFEIYGGYHRLGGRYVTIGSDAHNAARIGANFGQAVDMARQIGLAPVCFKQREMITA